MIRFNFYDNKTIHGQILEQGYKFKNPADYITGFLIKTSFQTLLQNKCLRSGTLQTMLIDSMNRELNKMIIKKQQKNGDNMANIIKFSGYLIDPNDDYCDRGDVANVLEKYTDMWTQHLHEEVVDIGEWDDESPLNYDNCDLAECEKYFKKEPSVKSDREPKVGEVYKHFKTGREVKVLAISQDTEHLGTFYIVYEYLEDGSVWNRPYDMFCSEVDREKYPNATQKYRFEKVE